MKKSGNIFIKSIRFIYLLCIITFGLMAIVGSIGGGGGDGSSSPSGVEDVIDTSMITFNVDTAKSLIATENIATKDRSTERNVRQDGKSVPAYIFRKPMTEAEKKIQKVENRSVDIQRPESEEVGCNLIAIDENGIASDALESLEELNVMYTLLSKDQKKVFVVLDPDYMYDSQNTIGATNCMMFVVDLQTNEYTCLDKGFAPQRIDNTFRRTISNSSVKPIQMDDDGNIYYLGRPFDHECWQDETIHCWVNIDWRIQPVIRMIPVKKDEDGNPLYNEDGYLLYEDSIDLTPDNNYIDNFLVSKDGILVYTHHNQETNIGGIKMYADGSTNELVTFKSVYMVTI